MIIKYNLWFLSCLTGSLFDFWYNCIFDYWYKALSCVRVKTWCCSSLGKSIVCAIVIDLCLPMVHFINICYAGRFSYLFFSLPKTPFASQWCMCIVAYNFLTQPTPHYLRVWDCHTNGHVSTPHTALPLRVHTRHPCTGLA